MKSSSAGLTIENPWKYSSQNVLKKLGVERNSGLVLKKLGVERNSGLKPLEVKERRRQFGLNRLHKVKTKSRET